MNPLDANDAPESEQVPSRAGASQRWLIERLDAVAAYGRGLQSQGPSIEEVLAQTQQAIEKLMDFDLSGFAWFDESGLDLKLREATPETARETLEAELEHQIAKGFIGWAVGRDRMVVAPTGGPGEWTVVGALTTQKATLGVFLGVTSEGFVPDAYLKLLAIVLMNCATAIENNSLYDELTRHSRELETRVVERTRALNTAKHALELANEGLRVSTANSRTLAKEAQEANAAKTEFLNNVSHDLRTSLNAIIGYAEIVLSRQSENDAQLYVHSILRESENLVTLINDLLDSAKIESGKLELEYRPYDLFLLMDCVEQNASVLLQEKTLEFNVALDPQVPQYVFGDPLRLGQILMNLVGNAIKFTNAGSVTVRVETIDAQAAKTRLRFSVTDTGIGIAKENQERIFESFAQAEGGTTRQYGGTGLGTAICQQLVTLMNGEIGLESEPGQGSTFWFIVPTDVCESTPELAAMAVTPENRPLREERIRPRQTGHILLVEDYAPNRDIARHHLESTGHTVLTCESGEEAIAACSERAFDLILMDVQMPGLDGNETTRRIRAGNSPSAKAPILALTAHANRAACEVSLAAGMNDIITKPIRRRTFLATLDVWLDPSTELSAQLPLALLGKIHAGDPPESEAPKPAHDASTPPMDVEKAVSEFAGNRDLVHQVAADFLLEVDKQRHIIRKALGEGELEAIRAEAHKIRGAAANLAAMPLAAAAEGLEQHAKAGALDEVRASIAKFESEFTRLKDFLSPPTS